MEIRSGTFVKGFELEERIGVGGFGAVYRAEQSTVGREVAIKIILPEYANRPEFIRRFESEARTVASLEHMHITPLYDFWRDPDGAYFVMRLMKGGSLSAAIRREHYDLEAAAVLLDQIASALSIAHRKDIIHRDIKPSNILLDEDGNAYLADFGIAKDLAGVSEGFTEANAIVGSPDYLSPEQARKEPVTPQTDIYSLGVVLYEVLTGEHPFPDQAPVARLFKHINDPLPEITALDEDVSDAINDVIQRATAKNPAERHKDVLKMAAAFREAAGLSPSRVAKSLVELLTPREQDVLQLIIERKTNREIADALSIELTTVKWYITQIYKKLKVRSRVQAIVRARELDLIVDGDLVIPTTSTDLTEFPEPENPYKGLRAFQSADEGDFFGREAITGKLLKRMSEDGEFTRFLAVVGPSGSGKSSLVRAGLIPALWRGELPGSERWYIVDMIPGPRPLDELEVALMRIAGNPAEGLREQLERDEFGLVRLSKLLLPEDESKLLVVIDQFEEVFSLVENEEERVHFLELLHAAVVDPRSRVRVVITLRADYYDRPLNYVDFGRLVQNRTETVLPLSAEELERAIVQPAKRIGLKFEEGLVPGIIEDVHYQPGALPLLQYALTELFDQRTNRTMTHEAYQAIGGTVGALANRAEEIYEDLSEESQEAARQMFLRLVTLGEGVEDTRRRVDRSEFMAIVGEDKQDAMDELIDNFAGYRLLTLDHDPATRAPTVEVAHEALLREWDRLRGWLNESREDIRLEQQLANLAWEWGNTGRDESYLLRGSRLEQYQDWQGKTDMVLTPLEREHLAGSIAARERRQVIESERQAREARLERTRRILSRGLIAVLVAGLLVALGLSYFAFGQRDEAEQNAALALAEADARATAEVDAREEAEALATSQLETEAQRQAALLQASIGLASQATLELQGTSPERSVLLALEALEKYPYTWQAERALGQAVFNNHLKLILNHDAWVNTAIWSPDQSRIVTASDDGTAKIWDAVTGDLTFTLEHDDWIPSAIWSPSGEQILTYTGGLEGTALYIWNANSGELTYSIPLRREKTYEVDWSPDGTRFLSSHENLDTHELHTNVWNASTGELLFELGAPGLCIEGLACTIGAKAWSPTGDKILTRDREGGFQIWDAASGASIWQIQAHDAQISSLSWSPSGDRILTASHNGSLKVWDSVAGVEILNLEGHSGEINSALWSPSGVRIVSAGFNDGTARVWDANSGEELVRFDEHNFIVWVADWSPSGRYIVTGSADGTAKVWDSSTGGIVQTVYGHDADVTFAAWSQDGKQIITAGPDGSAKVWNLSSETELLQVEGTEGAYWAFAWSPDETRLARSNKNGKIEIYDALDGSSLLSIQAHDDIVEGLAYSPAGEFLVTTSWDHTATVWDSNTGENIVTFRGHTAQLLGAEWSPDGDQIVTTGWHPDDTTARVWDSATGEEQLVFSEHQNWGLLWAKWSPDGTRIASVGRYGEAFIWDAKTGEVQLSLYPKENRFSVLAVAWSPDGNRIATHANDGILRIWDTHTGEELVTTPGHSGVLLTMDWLPSGERIFSGDSNGIFKMFDAESGAEVFSVHIPNYSEMALSPDGSRFATTASPSGPMKIFSLWGSLDELMDLARNCCVIRQLTPAERAQFGLPPIEEDG